MYANLQWVNRDTQHVLIRCEINNILSFVPLDPANTDYQNIMRLVEAGELTIADPE